MANNDTAILVTGDVVLDHNLYAGQRFSPVAPATTGLKHTACPGGATLTYEMLKALAQLPPIPNGPSAKLDVRFGLEGIDAAALERWPTQFKTGAVWSAFPPGAKGKQHWRLEKNLGYGPKERGDYPAQRAAGLDDLNPKIVVIDDGALGFRLASKCWPAIGAQHLEGGEKPWIILKMSSPIARGDLWRMLLEYWKERLIVVIAADNLRREEVRVTRGLSWEAAVDDLVGEVIANPVLADLRLARHVIITMRGDAALWMTNSSQGHPSCNLVFDRERGEGEWENSIGDGDAFGYLSAMTSALAWHIAAQSADKREHLALAPALAAGLSTSRFLRQFGHGPVEPNRTPGFPFAEAAKELLDPKHKYASSPVNCTDQGCMPPAGSKWTILRQRNYSDLFQGPLFGVARRVALFGPATLHDVPSARFGKLLTMERHEIESLRSVRQLMLSYKGKDGEPRKQPLSLAVFGAPGSGKSFGLKQIAIGVFGEKNPILEFNLSQFKGPEDLIGAYHQVRDHVLAGKTPVVFWDEFDSRDYYWLQYLLAPMQDGQFQEGQLTHSIGKCVFVFAGGTSRDFAHFGPNAEPQANETKEMKDARRRFVMAKGPDFKSRLAGYFDVLGPNPRQQFDEAKFRDELNPWTDDSSDIEFPIRRALLLRSLLGYVGDRENEILEIDRGLLTALLEVGHFLHGSRSMEKLVGQMSERGGFPLRRSYLPSDHLLALYVDNVEEFHRLVHRPRPFLAQAEKLAPHFHQNWLDNLPAHEKANNAYAVKYENLDPEGKAANVAAASRMPEILALCGFALLEGRAAKSADGAFEEFIHHPENLEYCAKLEHDGWMDQKEPEGWHHGPDKSISARTSPYICPYAELPEEQKDKDRRTIQNYPKYAEKAGFSIMLVPRK